MRRATIPDFVENSLFVAFMIASAIMIVNIWLWRHEEKYKKAKREKQRQNRLIERD
jgi:undecaprenyl pyrophosphate phosphatase UppP